MPVTKLQSRIIAAAGHNSVRRLRDRERRRINIGGGQWPDPVVLDIPIAYVKRPAADGEPRMPCASSDLPGGADLWLRDRAAADGARAQHDRRHDRRAMGRPRRRRLLGRQPGDLRHAQAADPGREDSEQPTWNIWEYDRTTDTLRRVIASDLSPRRATTSRRTTCRTAASCSRPRASGSQRRC